MDIAVLSDDFFAERLRPNVCKIVLALDPSDSQSVWFDFILQSPIIFPIPQKRIVVDTSYVFWVEDGIVFRAAEDDVTVRLIIDVNMVQDLSP